MTDIKPGRVWIPGSKGKFKPFLDFREIRKGKDKGKFEIILQPSRPKKIKVDRKDIKFFPQGPVAEHKELENLNLFEGKETSNGDQTPDIET